MNLLPSILILLFEPKGWSFAEKEVETKFSIQCIKNNLQELKEIAVFII